MPGLLLEIDLTGCPVLLVGLGAVGRRRLDLLVQARARIRAVDPAGPSVPEGVELCRSSYASHHLDGVRLAFAAGPPEVNRQVTAEARARGLWVNSASESAQGDVTVPATWRDGLFQLAVATSGSSPALAAHACSHAAGALGPAYAKLTAVLAELRPEIQARIPNPTVRSRLLKSWSDAAWLHQIEREGPDPVRALLRARLEQAAVCAEN